MAFYDAVVLPDITGVRVTATTSNRDATVTVNDAAVKSGEASDLITLEARPRTGSTEQRIQVRVTSTAGPYHVYNIDLSRPASAVQNLAVTPGTLSLSVSWGVPAYYGLSVANRKYRVRWRQKTPDDRLAWSPSDDGQEVNWVPTGRLNITGLTAAVDYQVQVWMETISGNGVKTQAEGVPTGTNTFALSMVDAAVGEGESAMLTVNLDQAPPPGGLTFDVIASYGGGPGNAESSDVGVVPSTVTLETGETSTTFAVPITQDHVDEEDETFDLAIVPESGVTSWAERSVGAGVATVTIGDDDTAGVMISRPPYLPQGATVTYTVRLESEPTSDVVITPSGSETDGTVTLAPTSHTISPDDWETPRTFMITGKTEGEVSLRHTVTGDPKYAALTTDTLSLTVHPSSVWSAVLTVADLDKAWGCLAGTADCSTGLSVSSVQVGGVSYDFRSISEYDRNHPSRPGRLRGRVRQGCERGVAVLSVLRGRPSLPTVGRRRRPCPCGVAERRSVLGGRRQGPVGDPGGTAEPGCPTRRDHRRNCCSSPATTSSPPPGALPPTATAPGAQIVRYGIQYKLSSATQWPHEETLTSTDPTVKIENLDNDVSYDVRVRAVNQSGPGDWSTPARSTPAVVQAWSSTLTVNRISGGLLGCKTSRQCSTSLAPTYINVPGRSHQVTELTYNPQTDQLKLTTGIELQQLEDHHLCVGRLHSYPLTTGETRLVWDNAGLSWSENDRIQLTIKTSCHLWAATLVPQTLTSGARGCRTSSPTTARRCTNPTTLTDHDFRLAGTDHTITRIALSADGALHLEFATPITQRLKAQRLWVGQTGFDLNTATIPTIAPNRATWTNTNLTWTTNQPIPLRINPSPSVWSGVLSVVSVGTGVWGCLAGTADCSTGLSVSSFQVGGVSYDFRSISEYDRNHPSRPGRLRVEFDKAVNEALRSYQFCVGARAFPLSGAGADHVPRGVAERRSVLGGRRQGPVGDPGGLPSRGARPAGTTVGTAARPRPRPAHRHLAPSPHRHRPRSADRSLRHPVQAVLGHAVAPRRDPDLHRPNRQNRKPGQRRQLRRASAGREPKRPRRLVNSRPKHPRRRPGVEQHTDRQPDQRGTARLQNQPSMQHLPCPHLHQRARKKPPGHRTDLQPPNRPTQTHHGHRTPTTRRPPPLRGDDCTATH